MTATTKRILEIAQDTAKELSHAGYREQAYQNVLEHLLKKDGFIVRSEVGVVYKLSDGFCFGHGRLDLIVTDQKTNETHNLELKSQVRPNQRQHLGQLARYMHHYRGDVTGGLLIYFNSWDSNVLHFVLPYKSK